LQRSPLRDVYGWINEFADQGVIRARPARVAREHTGHSSRHQGGGHGSAAQIRVLIVSRVGGRVNATAWGIDVDDTAPIAVGWLEGGREGGRERRAGGKAGGKDEWRYRRGGRYEEKEDEK